MKDDIIPLSNGTGIRYVRNVALALHLPLADFKLTRIAEGDGVFIPIFTLNTDKRVWGKDAQEFKYVILCLTNSPLIRLRRYQTGALGKHSAWRTGLARSVG